MELQNAPSTSRIDVIDGLRGLAILWVIGFHLFGQLIPRHWHDVWFAGIRLFPLTLLTNGPQAVPLFFILSGFVLTLPYARTLRTMTSWSDVRSFYRRRARRLLPLYAINILFLSTFVHPGTSPSDTLRSLLLFAMLLPPVMRVYHFVDGFNIVLWSLSVELWFCILMPLFLWKQRRERLPTMLLGAIVLSLTLRFTIASFAGVALQLQSQGILSLIRSIPAFLMGMTLAESFTVTPKRKLPLPTLVAGIIGILFGCLLLDMLRLKQLPPLVSPIAELVILVGFGFIIDSLLSSKRTLLYTVLTFWPLRMIGMMCYSLYIWHVPAIVILQPLLNVYRLLRYVALVFALAFLSYRYIEFGWVTDVRKLLPERRGKPTEEEHLRMVSQ